MSGTFRQLSACWSGLRKRGFVQNRDWRRRLGGEWFPALTWFQCICYRAFGLYVWFQDRFRDIELCEKLMPGERIVDALWRGLLGTSLMLEQGIPEGLFESSEQKLLKIDWKDGSGRLTWINGESSPGYTLRDIVSDSFVVMQYYGPMPQDLLNLAVEAVLEDLRNGELVLPNFKRVSSSTPDCTLLEWERPY